MSKNDIRRDHEKRALRKALSIVKNWWPVCEDENYLLKRANKIKKNRKQCSCSMCGNPRKHYKGKNRLTIQERKYL